MKKFSSLLLFLPLFLNAQDTLNVLFLGNSYTTSNNLPVLIENLAATNNQVLIHDKNTPGGHQLIQHASNATSISKIYSNNWDYVVLQEQSQKPSFPPAQVEADVYPYARQLDSMIVDNDSCTETVFYMTWGRENGDQANCASYPPLCTYEGMQDRLRTSYLEMTVDNNAICAPVGSAWWSARINNPTLSLYTADESHPNINGSYLAACVFYGTLFRESPVGNSFISTLSQTDAQFLQQMAHNAVFDSLETWNIGAFDLNTAFSYSDLGGYEISFSNESTNHDQCTWDFGDGNQSTAANPTHTYAAAGFYTVSLNCQNGCENETLIQQIEVSDPFSLPENSEEISVIYLPYNQQIKVDFKGEHSALLFNIRGQLIEQMNGFDYSYFSTESLSPGAYIVQVNGRAVKFILP